MGAECTRPATFATAAPARPAVPLAPKTPRTEPEIRHPPLSRGDGRGRNHHRPGTDPAPGHRTRALRSRRTLANVREKGPSAAPGGIGGSARQHRGPEGPYGSGVPPDPERRGGGPAAGGRSAALDPRARAPPGGVAQHRRGGLRAAARRGLPHLARRGGHLRHPRHPHASGERDRPLSASRPAALVVLPRAARHVRGPRGVRLPPRHSGRDPLPVRAVEGARLTTAPCRAGSGRGPISAGPAIPRCALP